MAQRVVPSSPPCGEVECRLAGESLESVREDLRRIAPSSLPVLITGPTGSGKGVAARWLHDLSRPNRPFVVLNCAAVTETLFESELFGHERGAFTGAVSKAQGLFAAAHDGTIVLDEIADMPLVVQAKLLRAIDERVARPVGGTREYRIEARIIAATHVDLEDATRRKVFRADLFHRVGISVRIPGLEERPSDIPAIARALLSRLERPITLDESAIAWLALQSWPGNVRELHHFLERAALFFTGSVGATHLATVRHGSGPIKIRALRDVRDEFEASYVKQVLTACGGNVSEAARLLGVGRMTVMSHRDGTPRKKENR